MVKLILKMSGKKTVEMAKYSGKNVFHYAAEAKKPDVLKHLLCMVKTIAYYGRKLNIFQFIYSQYSFMQVVFQ